MQFQHWGAFGWFYVKEAEEHGMIRICPMDSVQ